MVIEGHEEGVDQDAEDDEQVNERVEDDEGQELGKINKTLSMIHSASQL